MPPHSHQPATDEPCPAALVRHAEQIGVTDAEWVAAFLGVAGLTGSADCPVRLPTPLLLGLAYALRLYRWELGGVRLPATAALPPSREALLTVLGCLRTALPAEHLVDAAVRLGARVNVAAVEHLAWCAPDVLGTDVVLGPADDEENLVDALARFLWAHRCEATRHAEETE